MRSGGAISATAVGNAAALLALLGLGFLAPVGKAAPAPSAKRKAAPLFVSPAAGARLSGKVVWEARAAASSVYRVDFRIDDGPVVWSQWTAPYLYNGTDGHLDTRLLANGRQTLRVSEVDRAGRVVATAARVVTVANTTPSAPAKPLARSARAAEASLLVSPAAGATVSGKVVWKATAATSSVYRVDFRIDDGPVVWSQWTAPYLYNGTDGHLDTRLLANGRHTLSVTEVDRKDRVVATASRVVTVDNTTPSPPAPPVETSIKAARAGGCVPTTAVFYTSDEWSQLAQGLDADASVCAQYYISIPPESTDKTQMRANAAAQVDALGANFHALAEVNYTAWQDWVTSTGNSWFQAGQQARANMDAAGFNPADGDTWVVDEFPSTVRTGAGSARQDVAQLLQGLYEGESGDPDLQGMVFNVGVAQSEVSFADYKASLESWFQDSAFWSAMSSYVSDFFQEAYGDVRDYAVANTDPTTRAGWLDAFLQHPLTLATATDAPSSDAAAASFLGSAYGPLANASWGWSDGYGWTDVDAEVMTDFVSAQTDAMRASGDPRMGFAWNPVDQPGLSPADFETQSAGILTQLAASISETDGGDPSQACASTGCAAVLPSAALATGWGTFSSWTPTAATALSAPASLTAGSPSGPLELELQTGGVATSLPVATTLTLTSSSATGTFAAAPGGPWTATLELTLSPGAETVTYYMQDSSAGSPTVTANLDGQLTTQTDTVVAG